MNQSQQAAFDTIVNQLSYLRDAIDPDMTALAMAIFIEVARHPISEGVPMSRIVDRFGLSASTTSRNIYLLSSGFVRPNHPRKGFGLIRTDTVENDRRTLHVFLTPKGQTIAKGLLNIK